MKKLFRVGQADHGKGKVIFKWQPDGNLLATAGHNGLVHIFDRHGARVDELSVQGSGQVLDLAWDHEGESLAALEEGSGVVLIWDQGTRNVMKVDTNMKELSFMVWSKVGPQLAIGTEKGNLLIYNKQTRKKVPIMGKHSRRITCGAWSQDNQLALGSSDSMITVSEDDGTTMHQSELKYPPSQMSFGTNTDDRPGRGTVSVNMDGQSLLLHKLEDPDNPIELAFQERYGMIVSHEWFGDGYLLLGFSEGYLVVISTLLSEIGEEQFSGSFCDGHLTGLSFSSVSSKVALAGRGGITLVDMVECKEIAKDRITLGPEDGDICGVSWCPDGQILSVATTAGCVLNFLSHMPTIHASHGTRLAYLSSLREVSVVDAARSSSDSSSGKGKGANAKERDVDTARPTLIRVDLEPLFIGLGPSHVGVGMNNRVIFYSLQDGEKVDEQEYPSTVTQLEVSSGHAAAMCGGFVVLHTLGGAAGGAVGKDGKPIQERRKTFPDRDELEGESKVGGSGPGGSGSKGGRKGSGGGIHSMALVDSFLILGTAKGTIELFYMVDWVMLSGAELRHGSPVKSVSPNYLGSKVVFTDATGAGYLYCPTRKKSGSLLPLPVFPPGAKLVVWDRRDKNVVFVSDGAELHTYVHAPTSMGGGTVSKVGPAKISKEGGIAMEGEPSDIPHGFLPIVAVAGNITCQIAQSGTIGDFVAAPFSSVSVKSGAEAEDLKQTFLQNVSLLRLKTAWRAALLIDTPHYWLALSNKAMEVLDIDMAIQVYRQLGDAGMVMGLERIRHVEDKKLIAGHIALLFGDYQTAQDLFLDSSRPVSALDMRRDLLHWDQALQLARTFAPSDVPRISVEYGQQLEFKGEYDTALSMYEGALRAADGEGTPVPASPGVQGVCVAGIARCTLRLGDIRRGVRLAMESGEKQLFRECASILEDMKQVAEAAAMYEAGEQYERAAHLHVTNKNLAAAAEVMPHVRLPKLLMQYGKACEAAGKWQEAKAAYESARDMDSVVRLCLEQVEEPERAFEIVRTTASSTGAEMVSQYCQAQGDWRGAIEFLLLAKRTQEAFSLASSHEQVQVFTAVLGDAIGADEAVHVARYYEQKNDLGNAGKFYSLCGRYHRALKLFLQCGEKEVGAAIVVVGKARNDMLTHTLIDFLMGETDGVPKDPNYIYRLYMALGNFAQAAKTAIIIARQEQDLGNYKMAHSVLYETIRQLEGQRVKVSQALRRAFVLLHSYVLVKKLTAAGDHTAAARMLLRVAANISKFPAHIVQILTACVIQCQRAGLKDSAYEYASMLMRPEYRGQVDKKFRRTIEGIVRRPNREQEDERLTPCPICGEKLRGSALECTSTKDSLPMCVVSGRHMEKDDWTLCPVTQMPALLSEYKRYLEQEHEARLKKVEQAVTPAPAAGGRGGGRRGSTDSADGKSGDGDGPDEARRSSVSSNDDGPAININTPFGVFVGTDPILGTVLSTADLTKCSAEEVDEYIKAYNSLDTAGEEGGEGGGREGGGGPESNQQRGGAGAKSD